MKSRWSKRSANATVSLIVTVRDGERWLDACLASIVSSSHRELDIVLVDDGSTDDSGAIVDRWAAREQRVQVHHLAPVGRRAALELGHARAHGEVHGWVDADDLLHPAAVTSCLRRFDDEHELVYTHRELMDESGGARRPHAKNTIPYRPQQLLVDNMIFHLRLFTAELFARSGGIGDLESAIDWDMNLRMTELTTPACVPQVLYSYRVRHGRMSARPEQILNAKLAVDRAIARRQLDLDLVVSGTSWNLRRRTGHRPPNLR